MTLSAQPAQSAQAEPLVDLELHIANDLESDLKRKVPSQARFETWLTSTLTTLSISNPIEIGIRIVSKQESQALNKQYRNKDYATNVLSFESDLPEYIPSRFIGDLAICARVLLNEAQAQNKENNDHWAHLCIHGLLHLLGYDHICDDDAEIMESAEIKILAQLGIDDPYQTGED